MAFIAALIAIEKLLPWKEVANRGIAVLLLMLGIAVAFAPEDVPGLTLPGLPRGRCRRWRRWGKEARKPPRMGMDGSRWRSHAARRRNG